MKADEPIRLRFEELRSFFASDRIPHPWFPALKNSKQPELEITWYCALVPPARVKELANDGGGWDFSIGDGAPTTWSTFGDPPEQGYYPYGNDGGIEPVVIMRHFHHNRPSSVELAQEFRLFHNLFDDRKKGRFLFADDDGNESEAARYTDDSMEIRIDLLLKFCAAKQYALAIYVDAFAYSTNSLDELGLAPTSEHDSGDAFMWSYSINPWDSFMDDDRKTIARLLGRKYVLPGPMPEVWPSRSKEYHEFIIDTQPDGTPIRHTCDPDQLANFFGANPDAPIYLTPVFFRSEVLAKYYADPEKYEVEDGSVRCSGMWSMRMDNDNDDYVVAWLGDLGRDLSDKERAYWLSYNIPPDGRKISDTCYARAIRGWFADPKKADHAFKQAYRLFREDFRKADGWDLFLELHDADQYCFKILHAPLAENGAEFDDQLINLTKLLVDSLNEAEIAKGLATLEKGDPGITKFEKFCGEKLPNLPAEHIAFLRELQRLRSTSAAHRKGSRYDKLVADLGLEDRGYREVFNEMLVKATRFLLDLRAAFHLPER
ncbi:MAG: hypothetical protein MUF31_04315 [Akkermansiaceae bacterium]|jgi:hypothetical protein|nr:hypothetical protein [Akkermansiaceae bacterium]